MGKRKYVYEKDGKELCPVCNHEVVLDEPTLHNCGWNARWCWTCHNTYYTKDVIEERKEIARWLKEESKGE